MKPLCIDLFCGCFGWSAGWLELGGYVVGFDLEHLPHHGPIPNGADLVIQDVQTLHGRQFRDASLILASPPCQFFSYCAMPWSRAKKLATEVRASPERTAEATALFDACFRIQREAIEAAGHFIPMVVENVKGAQEWVGKSKYNYGSYHLWGDVPALMPKTEKRKVGRSFSQFAKTGIPSAAFNGAAHESKVQIAEGIKNTGGSWFYGAAATGGNPARGVTVGEAGCKNDGIKNARNWWSDGAGTLSATTGSKSSARKAASAAIAKIPFPLALHIAEVWRP